MTAGTPLGLAGEPGAARRWALPFAAGAFAAAMFLAAIAVENGVVPDDSVRLWAGATLAGDGNVSIGRIVAAYPTVPFLATVLVALVAPDGTPAPALVAAALLALIGALWLVAFAKAGLPLAAAIAATVLLAFHPMLLRATVAGPAELCLVLFLYLFGRALYDLRARSTTSEVMAVGLSLLGLAFSHPIGAAIAFSSVPFLVFAVRPVLVANSAFNVVIVLIFPSVFAVGAFYYLSWVFPGSGWSFFAAPAASLAAWSAGVARLFGDGVIGSPALDAAMATLVALTLGAPLVLIAIGSMYRRRPLLAPALVFVATVVTAAAISVGTGLFGDPAAIAAAAPVLAAIVVMRAPVVRERLAVFMLLLALGWLGGTVGLAVVDPATTTHIAALLDGSDDRERLDALALGGALAGRDGALVDTDTAPAVVIGRGRAHGLLAPPSEAFALTLLFRRFDAPYVALPNPQSNGGVNDRLNKAFPLMFRDGDPDYHVIYQNNTWRLYKRNGISTVSKD
jgi:hypothetical protein